MVVVGIVGGFLGGGCWYLLGDPVLLPYVAGRLTGPKSLNLLARNHLLGGQAVTCHVSIGFTADLCRSIGTMPLEELTSLHTTHLSVSLVEICL